MQDAASNQYFRMNRAAYGFVGQLDGRRTVGEVWRRCMETMQDAAPTQGEVIALLGQLYSSNLLTAGAGGDMDEAGGFSADAEAMFRRQRRRATLETQGRLASLLSLRIPLYDPDRAFTALAAMFGWCFTWFGAVAWLALVSVGLVSLAGRTGELVAASATALAPENLPWLYVAFVVAKLIHECGHGVACKVFGQREGTGGESHAIGVMLLVLLPAPYVDATSAWGLRSKWKRIAVGAAGMLSELALAAVAALVWSRAAEGTLVSALAANVILIAGVSTLLFNANPLLRYDGYYMLSDLLEIPNLHQRSRDVLKGFFRRRVFGARVTGEPPRPAGERWLLGAYGLASTVYVLFITGLITLYVADQWFFIGALLAVVAAGVWFVAPVVKFARYLATDPELDRTRGRAVWSVAAGALALVVLIGFVPAPRSVRLTGVIEADRHVEVRAPVDGFVESVAPASEVVEGAELVRASNAEAEAEARIIAARLDGLRAMRRQALAERPAEVAIESERIAALESQAQYAAEQLRGLMVKAPIGGFWTVDYSAPLRGRFVSRGERLGVVVDPSSVRVRAAAEQHAAAAVLGLERPGAVVRVKGRPDVEWRGEVERVVETGRRELPSRAMGASAGGELLERGASRSEGGEAAERLFEVVVTLRDAAPAAPVGTRVVVRIALAPEPIGVQLARWARQSLQRRFGG